MSEQRKFQQFEPLRMIGLSDAVFAIVLTLIVLELKIPGSDGNNLLHDLRSAMPKIEAWLLSFIILSTFWTIHHNIIALISRTDTLFNYLNLGFLLCISIIPWLSSLLGTYLTYPLAVMLFSGTLGIAGLLIFVQWLYACGQAGLVSKELDRTACRTISLLALRLPIVALLSIYLAPINRSASLWVWPLFTLLGLLIRGWRRREQSNEPASDFLSAAILLCQEVPICRQRRPHRRAILPLLAGEKPEARSG